MDDGDDPEYQAQAGTTDAAAGARRLHAQAAEARLAALVRLAAEEEVEARRRRIDFVFASPDLAKGCRSARVDVDDARVGLYSDHYPILFTVERE